MKVAGSLIKTAQKEQAWTEVAEELVCTALLTQESSVSSREPCFRTIIFDMLIFYLFMNYVILSFAVLTEYLHVR